MTEGAKPEGLKRRSGRLLQANSAVTLIEGSVAKERKKRAANYARQRCAPPPPAITPHMKMFPGFT